MGGLFSGELGGGPVPFGAGSTGGRSQAARGAAAQILEAFEDYHARFRGIARRSKRLFEARDWRGAQAAASERLILYRLQVESIVAALRAALGDGAPHPDLWRAAKAEYRRLTEPREEAEIARTFFNSVSRRVLGTVGVRPEEEFLGDETGAPGESEVPEAGLSGRSSPLRPADLARRPAPFRTYPAERPSAELLRRVLSDLGLRAPFRDLGRDAELASRAVAAELRRTGGDDRMEALEVVRSLFFRNKGAYVVGRIRGSFGTTPLILPLLNGERGVFVDAVLLTPDEASIVFGFSWSYFHVDAGRPRALVDFLRSFMPHKRVDELYTSIGYNRHGKTELYQRLREHLARPEARFEVAEGTRGMVMSVFTLPSLNVVFKVIKDRFAPPKQMSRQAVRERYRFVFLRDRVGRLADAQEFEHLQLRTDHFSAEVLGELLEEAPSTVRVDGERVAIEHLYTERRLTPLDLYLRRVMEQGDERAGLAALLDYGRAVKDLAAANIFPGDMLIKNFGVTRHGRIVFYDYDELSLLTECVFRHLPEPLHPEDELAGEAWFHVGERDIFPEEFPTFLAIPERLKPDFLKAHRDLFRAEFWQGMQERQRAGELVDIFPYPQWRRLGGGGEVK
ncbi:MAG: bifunctional isocitrate dehydrogenase kinase/phosphatase [Gemmatimonadota bacterium]